MTLPRPAWRPAGTAPLAARDLKLADFFHPPSFLLLWEFLVRGRAAAGALLPVVPSGCAVAEIRERSPACSAVAPAALRLCRAGRSAEARGAPQGPRAGGARRAAGGGRLRAGRAGARRRAAAAVHARGAPAPKAAGRPNPYPAPYTLLWTCYGGCSAAAVRLCHILRRGAVAVFPIIHFAQPSHILRKMSCRLCRGPGAAGPHAWSPGSGRQGPPQRVTMPWS